MNGAGRWAKAMRRGTIVLASAYVAVVLPGLAGCAGENAAGAREDSATGGRSSAARARGSVAGASAGAVSAGDTSAGRERTVLFIGTSLTVGLGLEPDSAYPRLVEQRIESAGLRYSVVNAGVSGETTAGLLSRLDWLLRRRADVIVIESGANDGLRAVPVEAIERNLEEVVRRVKAANPSARVLLVQMEAPPNLGADYTRAFRDVFPRVAERQGVQLMPFLLEGVAGHEGLNQPDGIHPNAAGSRKVAENVWRALEPVLRVQ